MAGVTSDLLVAVRIASVGNRPRARWAEGMHAHLPASLLDRTGWRRQVQPSGDLDIPADPVSISDHDVAGLRELRAFTDRRPISARLPVNYRLVPGWARAIAASAIGRLNRRRMDRWASFPAFPIDLSTDLLDDLREAPGTASPPNCRAPVVLSHDVDSAEGLRNLLSRFLPQEEAVGARSINYIVPCAWRLDHGLIAELVARGHEVGVHGYDHSNTTPFAAADDRRRRLDEPRAFAERYAAVGYRAPSLLRTRALLRDLGARYRHDSSIPTSGGLFPTPNNGCATARPFLVEDIVELPITLPRDGTLRFLGCSPEEILAMWIECADLVWRARGVVVLLTHCERRFSGHRGMVRAYRQFLDHLRDRSDRFTFSNATRVLRDVTLRAARFESGESTRVAAP
jgi:peptidoglycan/xylan/chitin deacetylase (PgdA/CDA1 family)